MELSFQKAGAAQLERLAELRVKVLRAANGLADDADMSEVERQTRAYFKTALADGSHAEYIACDGDKIVGIGGVSYFCVAPTYHNPTGMKAYIMNVYTEPEYRRRGIAARVVRLLIADAHSRGVAAVSLEATAAGRPLYEKLGFVPMPDEMELPDERTII